MFRGGLARPGGALGKALGVGWPDLLPTAANA